MIATSQGTYFAKGFGITKLLYPFAGRQTTAAVLAGNFFLTAHGLGCAIALLQLAKKRFPAFSMIAQNQSTLPGRSLIPGLFVEMIKGCPVIFLGGGYHLQRLFATIDKVDFYVDILARLHLVGAEIVLQALGFDRR
jgi:hypothetical protein